MNKTNLPEACKFTALKDLYAMCAQAPQDTTETSRIFRGSQN